MKIKCTKCYKYLGEIRDAKLRKGITYLCKECDTQRQALELRFKKPNSKDSESDLFDILGGIIR